MCINLNAFEDFRRLDCAKTAITPEWKRIFEFGFLFSSAHVAAYEPQKNPIWPKLTFTPLFRVPAQIRKHNVKSIRKELDFPTKMIQK